MYGLYKPRRKKVEFIKLVDTVETEKDKPTEPIRKMTTKGAHLLLDKTIVDKSKTITKTELSKLLVNMIKDKTDKSNRIGNKIYNYYSKEANSSGGKRLSVIKQFYTPQVNPEPSPQNERKSKSLILTTVNKNKNEIVALREYISNKRTDSKVYEKILRNILVKGYKNLPEKHNLTGSYGYTFDEKLFMKYNFILQRDTNLKFVLDSLKTKYVNTQGKPRDFLSLSSTNFKFRPKSQTSSMTEKQLALLTAGNVLKKNDETISKEFVKRDSTRLMSARMLKTESGRNSKQLLSKNNNITNNKFILETIS
jgi:hypothetical protein